MMRLVIAALFLSVVREAQGVKTCTNGVLGQGDLCGGRRCAGEAAFCDTSKEQPRCTCNHGVGEGGLLCGGPNDKSVSIMNDPKVDTYDEEKIDVPVPCQYLLTHVRTNFTWMGQPAACNVKVYVANRRILGKQFASNVMVEISTEGPQVVEYTYKVDGEASNGEYCFWRKMKTGSSGNFGNNLNSFVAGSSVEFSVENATNRAHIVAPGCGVAVAFRPADSLLGRNQTQLPGVVVKLLSNVGVEYRSNDVVVGVNRDAFNNGNDFGPEDRTAIDTMIYRAIKSDAPQKFKWKSNQCSNLQNVFNQCRTGGQEDEDKVTEALRYCRFALIRPKFVTCWSNENGGDNAEAVLDLFKACVKAQCQQSTNECQEIKDDIDSHPNCKSELEGLEEEVLNDTCGFE